MLVANFRSTNRLCFAHCLDYFTWFRSQFAIATKASLIGHDLWKSNKFANALVLFLAIIFSDDAKCWAHAETLLSGSRHALSEDFRILRACSRTTAVPLHIDCAPSTTCNSKCQKLRSAKTLKDVEWYVHTANSLLLPKFVGHNVKYFWNMLLRLVPSFVTFAVDDATNLQYAVVPCHAAI